MAKKLLSLLFIVISTLLFNYRAYAQCGIPTGGDPLPNLNIINPLCYGDLGEITINSYSSNFTYPYNWELRADNNSILLSGYASSQFSPISLGTINELTAGTYTLYTCDYSNNRYTNIITIVEPTLLSVFITTQSPSCIEANDGEMTAIVTGGLPPYTYSWSNQETTQTITGISAGNELGVYPIDANGCTTSTSTPMPFPTNPTLYISPVGVICSGNPLSLNSSNSFQNPSYNWTGPNGFNSIMQNPFISSLNTSHKGWYFLNVTTGVCNLNDSVFVDVVDGPAIVNLISSDETCSNANGAINILSVSGGVAPYLYSFSGSNYSTAVDYLSLTSGTYSLNVMDANGCYHNAPVVTINNIIAPVDINVTVSDETCTSSNGQIDLGTVTGGAAPYQYNFNGIGFSATTIYPNLYAGTYTLVVQDANNCLYYAPNIIIYNQPAPSISATPTNSTCGYPNGTINANGIGGMPPYTFSIDGGNTYQTDGIFNNLSAGTYTVTIKDINGCTNTTIGTINDQNGLTSTIMNQTNVSCFGGNDGSFAVDGSGSTAPYTYSLDEINYFSIGTFTGLPAGSYTIALKDGNGCIIYQAITLTEPSQLTASINSINPSTCGNSNGNIDTYGMGGIPPYTYSIDGGITYQGGGIFSNLLSGSYSVTVSDNNNCTATIPVNINDLSGLTASISSQTDVTCYGMNDGTVTILGSGSSGYTYSFDGTNFQANDNFTNLAAGLYSFFVKDINGCTISQEVTINEPNQLTISIANSLDETCNSSNGLLTLGATGGTASYTYSIDGINYSPNNTFTNLSAGNYTITVQDANGCFESSIATINSIAGPSDILVSTYSETCTLNNGQIDLGAVTGGLAPYQYNFNGSGFTSITTYSGLSAGSYTLVVQDANACIFNAPDLIMTDLNGPSAIAFTVSDEICNSANGQIVLGTVTGGVAPYLFNFQGTGYASSTTFTGLVANNYSLSVTDVNGCILNAPPIIVNSQVGPSAINYTVTNAACFSGYGKIKIDNITGGVSPFQYNINGSAFSSLLDFNGLIAGTYTLGVKDLNGCISTANATITEPSLLAGTTTQTNATCGNANGSATVTATGGIIPYAYSWSNGNTTSSVSGLGAIAYSVIISDANGCTTTKNVNIGNTDGPSVISFTSTPTTCPSACDGTTSVTVSGGTAPYAYLWNTSGVQNANTTNACFGNNLVTVTDANNCKATASVYVTSTGTNPSLNGFVYIIDNTTSDTIPVTGKVQIYPISNNGAFNLTLNAQIINGVYNIQDFPIGEYLIAATPDSLIHPFAIKTYYNYHHKWIDGDTITTNCNNNLLLDIRVIDLSPLTGDATISGTIYNVTGGKRISDPLPGVDVSLEEDPEGIISHSSTDENGFFVFNNVPDGAYKIYVDIPGLGMVQTHFMTVNATDTVFENKDFFVDSTGTINIFYSPNSISSITSNTLNASIYPNPYSKNTNITFTIEEKSFVNIEVYNLLGESITILENKTIDSGFHKYQFSAKALNQSPGIYIVKIDIENQTQTTRIIELE